LYLEALVTFDAYSHVEEELWWKRNVRRRIQGISALFYLTQLAFSV
jgi:hypothetical protein